MNTNSDTSINRVERAVNLHKTVYNCSQAVICAFSDAVGLDEVTAFRIGEGFGFGCGGAEGICGALSAAVMLAGLKNSDGKLTESHSKGATTKLSKEIFARFKEKTGALVCKDLKGLETGVVLCSCPDCVKAASECVEEVLGL